MANTDPRSQPQSPQAPQPGTDELNRSENLLPGDDGAEDGRFEVAEEVALDIQGDDTRRVGQLPEDLPGSVTESMPSTVQTEPEDENKDTP